MSQPLPLAIQLSNAGVPLTTALAKLGRVGWPGVADDAYGVRRRDTNEIVLAAGTALPHIGDGVYSIEIADPAGGVIYDWILAYTATVNGVPVRRRKLLSKRAALGLNLPMLVSLAEASQLAPKLSVPNFVAGDDAEREISIVQATAEIRALVGYSFNLPDAELPQSVKIAAMYQADAHLDKERARHLRALSFGLASQSVGNRSESYRNSADAIAMQPTPRTMQLLQQFAITQGDWE